MGSHNTQADIYSLHETRGSWIVDPGNGGHVDLAAKDGGVLNVTGGSRILPPAPRGVTVLVFASAPTVIYGHDSSITAVLEADEATWCVSDGDGRWHNITMVPSEVSRGVLTMAPPDDEEDYTATLIAGMSLRVNGEPVDLYFPPGDYHFYGPLPTSIDLDIWDAFTWIASPSGPTVQHRLEAGNGNEIRDRAVFHVHLDNESDVWMDIEREYRFGPIYMGRGITVSLVDKGSAFSFGGEGLGDNDYTASCRGLYLILDLERSTTGYNSSDVGDGRAWLVSAGADAYILNTTNTSFGLRLRRCYDSYVEVYAYWFKNAVINSRSDRLEGKIRASLCGRALLETPNTSGVVAHWISLYAEHPLLVGVVAYSRISDIRTEANVGTPAPGVYALPASAAWTVTAGSSTITFTFGGAYDCTDYFEPYTLIRLAPGGTEPDRWFFITAVSDNSLTFADSTNHCYVGRTITGDGTECFRYFGIGLIGVGDKFDCVARSTGQHGVTLPPIDAVVLSVTPNRLAANSGARSADATSPQQPVIVASSCGIQECVHASVDYIGSAGASEHPLMNLGGVGPRWHRRIRECEYDPISRKFLAKPGRGVATINNEARDLTFHTLTETNSETVYAYRPSDSATGWTVRDTRLVANEPFAVTARVYVTTGSTTVTVSCESGESEVSGSLGTGWHTITLTVPDTETAGDADGAYLKFTGSNYFVSWVVIDQS